MVVNGNNSLPLLPLVPSGLQLTSSLSLSLKPRSSMASSIDPKPRKKGFTAFRGLGCTSSSSAAAFLPDSSAAAAAVRSSADWQGDRKPKKNKNKNKKKKKRKKESTSSSGVADVSDVWCAPGVVFGAEASVECVVAHRRDRERERAAHRERGSWIATRHGGGGGEEMLLSSLLEFGSAMEDPHFGSGSDPPQLSRHLRLMRGGGGAYHRRPPAEFEEMMMFQNRVLLGGMDLYDRFKDLRLDMDNMSYEDLLELSEKIGYVSTGLKEEEILHNLRKPKHSVFGASPSKKDWKCIICQEEYEVNDDMGKLECGHTYHTHCIKQWLLRKNACPVCKIAITRT